MKLMFLAARLAYLLIALFPTKRHKSKKLVFSVGAKGWESIEFKELYASAVEWLGADQVSALEYHPQMTVFDELRDCSHYFYDPRTGYDYSEEPSRRRRASLFRAIKIGIICAWRGITPIAYVTDFSLRDWRASGFIATAKSGLVLCCLSPVSVGSRYLWHDRVTGPMPMALSKSLSNKLSKDISSPSSILISFSGTLYEPRKSFINDLAKKCKAEGYDLVVNSRKIGGLRRSDEEYWKELSDSVFVVSTSDQDLEDELDFRDVKNLPYRFSEALMAGACLISDVPDGVELHFKPGEHFVVANTVDDVIEILHDYQRRPEFYSKIAQRGHKRAQVIADCFYFWNTINTALGPDGMQ
ncbi:glycosyltransferase [Gammaproteobacteria bacterium]|nr:glycosyltransferase [Gammaproteobacteria bacterium]